MQQTFENQLSSRFPNIDGDFNADHFQNSGPYNCDEETNELHFAAFNGDLKVVRQLVEMGEDIDALSFMRSPLLIACGSVENSMLEPGMSLLGADSSGKRPPRTSYSRHLISLYLIEKGANIEFRDGANRSVLDLSCQAGNLEMVRILLNLNAKMNREGFSTLHCALKGRNLAVIRLILERDQFHCYTTNKRCDYEGTPLEMALTKMWKHPYIVEICEYLLQAGAFINTVNEITLETPLYLVCKNPDSPPELLRLLLKYNCYIHPVGEVSPLKYLFDKLSLCEGGIILNGCDVEKISIILRHVFEMNQTTSIVWLPTQRELHKIYSQIKFELELMSAPIGELEQMSFLDLLCYDTDILGCIFEIGQHFVNDIVSSVVKKLPIFGYPVKMKWLKIYSRRTVFNSALNVFYKYISCYQLPFKIVGKIVRLLPTSDLHSLCNIFKVENTHCKYCDVQDQSNDSEWFAGLNPTNPPSFLFDNIPAKITHVFDGHYGNVQTVLSEERKMVPLYDGDELVAIVYPSEVP